MNISKIKSALIALLITCFSLPLVAGEGMWIPLLLKALNEAEMQDMGMKLTAEDIYSVNNGSLKDAIVHFGGFCTSEIISDQGLLLTNHHCGYGQIQSHSSVENNYLKNGFWAKSQKDELPNPGLSATFIERIEDITDQALMGVTDDMDSKARQSQIDKNLDKIRSEIELKSYEDIIIRPFYHGNQYFMFVTVTYLDVRLVGTPPESIGKFGADTDNWVWPRHTGDFALFRIYAGPDNLPAEYSEENVPFKPKHFLPISLDGVEEGDFTMVFGFPGRTNQYLPGDAVAQTMDVLNPAKIEIRDRALKILDKYMRKDEGTRIKYASKFARIANYWKKWIGENQGLKRTNAMAKKNALEADFTARVSDPAYKAKGYDKILPKFKELYKAIEPYALTRDYYNEVVGRNIELMRISGIISRLVNNYESGGDQAYEAYKSRVSSFLAGFYKDYEANIDKEVFASLVSYYAENVNGMYVPDHLKNVDSFEKLANEIYANSAFTSLEKSSAILAMSNEEAVAKIKSDPLYTFGVRWSEIYSSMVSPKYNEINVEIQENQRLYMKALMEVFPDKRFFPDANSTMRVTYGLVEGYKPRDAVYYTPVTYLDGAIAKYVPGDYEFDISPKLLELYEKKDYGQYADTNGQVPICFIGSNHTTGGNSGSPAIDAHGNLIGLNFDRVWEGTMSDINYDRSICRNIMVDARYILFIIDKYAGAGHLIDEMKLVHPKRK